MHQVVIIGGGIAGLAAAFECRARGLQPLVLEASTRAGGVVVTDRTDGFVIDGGPDSILAQKPAAVALCRELGIADRLVSTLPPRTAFVLRSGRLVTLPEASFLGLPTRLGSLATTKLFSWPAKLRMALELVRPARRDEDDESIGQFMRRRFGGEAVSYLAEPLLAGIHAGDVERLSLPALFPRLVEAERSHGSVLRTLFASRRPPSTQGAFVSFREGLAVVIESLVAALGTATIRYDARVAQIDGRGPFTIVLATGEHLAARSVIVATPAWAAAPLLRSIDEAIASRCAGIAYASSATVFVGLRRYQVRHTLQGTGFVVPRVEGRSLMAGTWVSSKWPNRAPDGHVLLRGFVGGATNESVLECSDQALTDLVFQELAALLGITGAPLMTRIYRWTRATPQYNVGHLARVEEIDARLRRVPGLYLTGSGYRGTGLPDCVADARDVAIRAATETLKPGAH
jgi:oxygen-dependent protoporphyrinogen oxidase